MSVKILKRKSFKILLILSIILSLSIQSLTIFSLSAEDLEDLEDPSKIYAISCATGDEHSLVLDKSGYVYACGNNDYGQLGDGSKDSSSELVQVYGLGSIASVYAGGKSSFAIDIAGNIYHWGKVLSDSTDSSFNNILKTPTKVPGINNVSELAVGSNFVIALKNDGTVWSWGSNFEGQLGLGHNLSTTEPSKVELQGNISSIYAGSDFAAALIEDGSVWAWGNNRSGQLAIGKGINSSNIPVKMYDVSKVKKITLGFDHGLILTKDGDVLSFGGNKYGQLMDKTTNNSSFAKKVDFGTRLFPRDIAAGKNFSIISDDSKLYGCGLNSDGQIGSKKTGSIISGIEEFDTSKSIENIQTSNEHILILLEDGTIKAYGSTRFGKLGNSKINNSLKPVLVPISEKVKKIAVGNTHSVFLTESNNIKGVGSSEFGQLGKKYQTEIQALKSIDYSGKIVDISCGDNVTYILDDKNLAYAMGENDLNQLARKEWLPMASSLEKIEGLYNIQSIFSGNNNGASIDKSGKLYTYGDNSSKKSGEISDDTRAPNGVNSISNINQVKKVSLGKDHSAAITSSGELYTWGLNAKGQLGKETKNVTDNISKINGLSSVLDVACGDNFTAVLLDNGKVKIAGELKYSNWTSMHLSELQVFKEIPELNDITSIESGQDYILALDKKGDVYAVGGNIKGQLGLGNNIDSYKVLQVKALKNIKSIAAKFYSSFAIDGSGKVFAFGDNSKCQLGIDSDLSNTIFHLNRPNKDSIKVIFGDNKIISDVEPQIYNSRTMLPFRAIFEKVNADISWDNNTKKITAKKDGTSIILFVNNSTATVNDKPYILDCPPIIQNGRTLVPLRFIAEALDYKVTWEPVTKTVNIITTQEFIKR